MVVPGRRTAAEFARSPVEGGPVPGSCPQSVVEIVVAAAAVAAGIVVVVVVVVVVAAAAAAKKKDWLVDIRCSCPGYAMLPDLGPWPANWRFHLLLLLLLLLL